MCVCVCVWGGEFETYDSTIFLTYRNVVLPRNITYISTLVISLLPSYLHLHRRKNYISISVQTPSPLPLMITIEDLLFVSICSTRNIRAY